MRLVDADALKERYYQKMKDLLMPTRTVDLSDNAISLLCGSSLIIDAPTIDAEPVKRGYWTNARTMEHDGEWYCSVCGYEPTVFENTLYCSNCGAKMNGERWVSE